MTRPSIAESKFIELINDLWWFIENVTESTPDRTERFFELRGRVRTCDELCDTDDEENPDD